MTTITMKAQEQLKGIVFGFEPEQPTLPEAIELPYDLAGPLPENEHVLLLPKSIVSARERVSFRPWTADWTSFSAMGDLLGKVAPLIIDFPLESVRSSDQSENVPRAYRAFKAIGDLLEATDEEVAAAVGIGRTTPYGWLRDRREPRRGNARRIYEYHSVLVALENALGRDGLHRWLFDGKPSPRALMLEGNLAEAERRAHEILFAGGPGRSDLEWRLEEEASDHGSHRPAGSSRRRPSGRRPRSRGRK